MIAFIHLPMVRYVVPGGGAHAEEEAAAAASVAAGGLLILAKNEFSPKIPGATSTGK